MNSVTDSLSRCVAVLTLAITLGCGGDEVELGDVSGKVTMDGKPLPNATIRFIPESGGRAALAMTDAKGEYTMEYSAGASGAIVGPVRVEISTLNPDDPRLYPETVPRRYNASSVLREVVTSGGNEINFELTSK